jgi:hypothetical protein
MTVAYGRSILKQPTHFAGLNRRNPGLVVPDAEGNEQAFAVEVPGETGGELGWTQSLSSVHRPKFSRP